MASIGSSALDQSIGIAEVVNSALNAALGVAEALGIQLLKIRFINVMDLCCLTPVSGHPYALNVQDFDGIGPNVVGAWWVLRKGEATPPRSIDSYGKVVGVRGFEPPTPASRTQYSTRLSYTPRQMADSDTS
jgi:hypothetical protein